MLFEQIYLGCLAQASYLIGSDGEAAVVDPRRDVDEYVRKAEEAGLRIRYVVETHLHADFVSGHRELAERTGATILIGAQAGALFPHRAIEDGDEVKVGRVVLRFLETPGHTPESLSVLVIDTEHSPEPRMVLTGDTLFIGDVGRPDLVGTRGLSADYMAGLLYDSLHEKLLTLPDAVEVYPAHGAGSLCGKNISKETWSTIGEQRRSNYALQPMSRDAFVATMTRDLPEQPRYFGMDVEINRRGAPALGAHEPPQGLDAADFAAARAAGAAVVDVRPNVEFGAGHVPGSVNVGLGGQFASWAGTLLDPKQPLLLVAGDDERVKEAVMRLGRVGLENVTGYLAGGIEAWRAAGRPLATITQISVSDLRALKAKDDRLQIVDVRRPGEYAGGHVPGAVAAPLDRLDVKGLDPSRPTAVICAGGYRSSAAASLLEQRGFKDVRNVLGGTAAWVKAGYEVAT
jgi:glyoxylase-like metal-dependent hydrolase (beta-lactamase superfamily II)/3-mercaptopyruvate sulfurtransferase SseA